MSGVEIPYCPSGVAPRVLLGNYNVFPGDVASARSEDIVNALETAYEDGFDIANMSLGGGARGVQDLLTHAVNNLDEAGFISADCRRKQWPWKFHSGVSGFCRARIDGRREHRGSIRRRACQRPKRDASDLDWGSSG